MLRTCVWVCVGGWVYEGEERAQGAARKGVCGLARLLDAARAARPNFTLHPPPPP